LLVRAIGIAIRAIGSDGAASWIVLHPKDETLPTIWTMDRW
jgi:hypothetical protein